MEHSCPTCGVMCDEDDREEDYRHENREGETIINYYFECEDCGTEFKVIETTSEEVEITNMQDD